MDTTESKEELQANETAGTDGNQDAVGEERTFTSADVTRIVRNRLEQQARKHEREISGLRESLKANVERAQHLEHDRYQVNQHREELEELRAYKSQRERQDMLQRISGEFGVPVELLHGDTEEELTDSASAIAGYLQSQRPQVPNVNAAGATPAPDFTMESISRIADRKERMKAIAEHADKFGMSGRDFDALGEFID